MGVTSVPGNDIKAVGAYVRVDGLGRPANIQPDAARPRFTVVDGLSSRRPVVDPKQDVGPPSPEDGVREATERAARRPRGLGRPNAAFFAQAIAQESEGDTPPPSIFAAGTQAYRSQPAPPQQTLDGQRQAQIIDPFPRLASGRTLDLTV